MTYNVTCDILSVEVREMRNLMALIGRAVTALELIAQNLVSLNQVMASGEEVETEVEQSPVIFGFAGGTA